jgi:hypothetical protein
MYPRIKEISGRQYIYLVEGVRDGSNIRQKTLAYLGSLSTLSFGIPLSVRDKVERKLCRDINWPQITRKITKMPVRFDEFATKRRGLYARIKAQESSPSVKSRRLPPDPSRLLGERVLGELDALAKLARRSFKSKFEQTGPYAYRLRIRR